MDKHYLIKIDGIICQDTRDEITQEELQGVTAGLAQFLNASGFYFAGEITRQSVADYVNQK